MKILSFLFCTLFSLVSLSDTLPYELVNDNNGFSYIQINENLESFTFKSDFKSIGNSGIVGYYINGVKSDQTFSKKEPELTISNLNADDKITFYLLRNNGNLIKTFKFEDFHNKTYIAFDKNGGGKDEWMSIDNIETKSPSGQPLPFIPVIIFGVFSLSLIYIKKCHLINNSSKLTQ